MACLFVYVPSSAKVLFKVVVSVVLAITLLFFFPIQLHQRLSLFGYFISAGALGWEVWVGLEVDLVELTTCLA